MGSMHRTPRCPAQPPAVVAIPLLQRKRKSGPRPVIAAAAEKERQTAVSCSQTRWQLPLGERELCSLPDRSIRACALENGSPGTPCSSTRR